MNVVAVVVVGARLGEASDPDVLSPLGGVPVVVRSVRAMLDVGAEVFVWAGTRLATQVAQACAELPVTVGGSVADLLDMVAQRTVPAEGDGLVTDRGIVLLHDAARPIVSSELTRAVLAAARTGHRVVVPVLPLPDTVKTLDHRGDVRATPDRAGLRVVQTPQAFAVDLLPRVLPVAARNPVHGWAAAGERVHTVPGHPLAFAVHRAWDLELAESTVGVGA